MNNDNDLLFRAINTLNRKTDMMVALISFSFILNAIMLVLIGYLVVNR